MKQVPIKVQNGEKTVMDKGQQVKVKVLLDGLKFVMEPGDFTPAGLDTAEATIRGRYPNREWTKDDEPLGRYAALVCLINYGLDLQERQAVKGGAQPGAEQRRLAAAMWVGSAPEGAEFKGDLFNAELDGPKARAAWLDDLYAEDGPRIEAWLAAKRAGRAGQAA